MIALHGKRWGAVLALLGCALLWSTGGLGIKSITLPPMAINGYRFLIAAIFFGVQLRNFAFPRSKWAVASSVSNMLVMLFFVLANVLTTAANAILLQYTSPVFVCLLMWFLFKQKPLRMDMLVIGITLAGMALFFLDSLSIAFTATATLGNVLAVVSGLCFATQAVSIGRAVRGGENPKRLLFYGNALGFVICLPFLFGALPTLNDIILLLFLGLVQVGGAYLLYLYALDKVTPLELILIPIIEPLLSPLWVFLGTGEAPGVLPIIGGGIVVCAVTLWCVMRPKRQRGE